MKNKRVEKLLQALIILIIIGISVALMIVPERLNYSHSLKFLKYKNNNVTSLSADISKNEEIIKTEKIEQKKLEGQKKDAKTLRELLERSKYFINLEVPSMLIFLEQEAIASNVKIDINFDKIINHEIINENMNKQVQSIDNNSDPAMEVIPNKDTNVNIDTSSADIKNTDTPPNETNNPKNTTTEKSKENPSTTDAGTKTDNVGNSNNAKFKNQEVSVIAGETIELSDSIIYGEIPDIEGLDVTLVPITIRGSYENIGNFVKRLDVIDYLEPAYMGTYSTGQEVISTIALFVYHREGGI